MCSSFISKLFVFILNPLINPAVEQVPSLCLGDLLNPVMLKFVRSIPEFVEAEKIAQQTLSKACRGSLGTGQ